MLLHIAPGHQRADIVSLPRDSMVPICPARRNSAAGLIGQQAQPGTLERLNATFAYGGPVCLWKTLEQLTHVRIQHFVEVNFSGFQSIVNDVGGVSVCLPYAIDDPQSGAETAGRPAHGQRGPGARFRPRARERRRWFRPASASSGSSSSWMPCCTSSRAPTCSADPTRILHVVTDAAKSLTTDSGLDLTHPAEDREQHEVPQLQRVDFVSVPDGGLPA